VAAELGRRVWEPLTPHLAGARTVLVAPDGALMAFPFAALPGSRPGSYLVEDLALGYVASGRQAVEALAEPEGPAGRGLLAVGAVDFQTDPGQSSPTPWPAVLAPMVAQRAWFNPLPATGPEARAARNLFRAAFADQPATLLTGAEPTKSEVKGRLDGGRLRVVHLATHGFFESPARIAALRAAVRQEDPLNLALQAGQDDLTLALTPLLHSGVVLAGGGRDPGAAASDPTADAPPREDGILTAEEVQALDLRGCELVVLSACETGLGVGEYGQGVLGLQRAFQAAGARAVVASLWKVDDAATGALMEQFYTNFWTKKLPKLEALRQAQLAVLNDPGLVARYADRLRGLDEKAKPLPTGVVPYVDHPAARSDPALWAAFVLGGDGR
jgi:CHAT domain-containing protein